MTDPLANLRTLLEKATPGPWMNNQYYECAHTHSSKVAVRPVFHYSHNNPNAEQDAALIVAAVNALPKLLSVAEAARALDEAIGGVEIHAIHMKPDGLNRAKAVVKCKAGVQAALAALREGTP